MPPKSKFVREEVIAAALKIVQREGVAALTARSLATELGSSARPIFTLFEGGMDEVVHATERAARDLYNGYIQNGLQEPLAFKGVGKAYIRFSVEQPRLFSWLFMSECNAGRANVLSQIDENYGAILSSVCNQFGLERETAERVYRHLWIYSHGIATLCATGTCAFTEEEISDMLTAVCTAIIFRAKKGELTC